MVKIYSTLSRKEEILKPRKGKKINFFVCGITVYDFSHLGHARTYIAFDMIAKYLRQKGYDVFYLQNVTDIDDKIIQRAKELGEDPKKLARRFEKEYRADMKALGVSAVNTYARATDHIAEIIDQIRRLLKKGYAYEIEGDGIYFDISKFKEYGKLSRRTTGQAKDAVSRIDESVSKRNKGDFALWKFSKPGEPKWKSPWGWGRPGWHIEDTAITEKFFGPQYDIHGGAQDLIFPHHEAEITQMESVSGKKPFVKYWMHTGFLTVRGEKMSKSVGNFITIRDFLKEHSPRLLRYFVLKTHYRSPIDYSEEVLEQTQNELGKIDEFMDRLREKPQASIRHLADKSQANLKLKRIKDSFEKAMEDDLNTTLAISILFDLIREENTRMDEGKLSKAERKEILAFLKEIDELFGFIFRGREKQVVPAEIKKLAEQREAYRRQGDFQEADALRAAMQKRGWAVEDTPSGWKLKKLV
ncbi:MAG: cysteine--tRNA ligase [Candidatus Wildermuthbacteria bacterium]|nr:cysteine--tRNA ligase [Candidatus Wildermuthbacteria bacterium]